MNFPSNTPEFRGKIFTFLPPKITSKNITFLTYDIAGSSLLIFYLYLHKILIYSFSHIDLSFSAHLHSIYYSSSSSVLIIGEVLKSSLLIEEPPLINNFGSITSNWSCLFIGFNIAEFSTNVIYFS